MHSCETGAMVPAAQYGVQPCLGPGTRPLLNSSLHRTPGPGWVTSGSRAARGGMMCWLWKAHWTSDPTASPWSAQQRCPPVCSTLWCLVSARCSDRKSRPYCRDPRSAADVAKTR
jgi:hypothetical protein